MSFKPSDTLNIPTPIIPIDSIKLDSLEKLIYQNISDKLDHHYISIIEKVNSEVSLTWTPWAVIFTALACLFTFGSIVAGIIIFAQGNQFKNNRKELLKNAKDEISELINLYQTSLADFGKQRQEKIEVLNKYMASLESKKSKSDKDDTEIKSIKSDIEELTTKPLFSSIQSNNSRFLFDPSYKKELLFSQKDSYEVKCNKCKHVYKYQNPSLINTITGMRHMPIFSKCPKCDEMNTIKTN